MSQAIVNEVKSLRARVEALERHLAALEANLSIHYQRKRGPKPLSVGENSGNAEKQPRAI